MTPPKKTTIEKVDEKFAKEDEAKKPRPNENDSARIAAESVKPGEPIPRDGSMATLPQKTLDEIRLENSKELDEAARTDLAPTASEATYVPEKATDPDNEDAPLFCGEVDRALYLQQKARFG